MFALFHVERIFAEMLGPAARARVNSGTVADIVFNYHSLALVIVGQEVVVAGFRS